MKTLTIVLLIIGCVLNVYAEDDDASVDYRGKRMRLKPFTRAFATGGGIVGEVPEGYNGAQMSVVDVYLNPKPFEESNPQPLTFKVKKPGFVYIIVDGGSSTRFIRDGWVKVAQGTYGWNNDYLRDFHIMKKHLETGEFSIPPCPGFGTRIIVR